MTVASQTFTGIDAGKWQRIKAAVLAKTGITIGADTGEAGAKGLTIQWHYMFATNELDIALVKREWFDPSEETIDTDIAELVKAA